MAGPHTKYEEPTEETRQRWELSRRTDAADRLALVFDLPFHGRAEDGDWYYGISPLGGMPNPDFQSEFEAAVTSAVRDSAVILADAQLLTDKNPDALTPHHYEVGPASQFWPMLFADVFGRANMVVNSAGGWIAIAGFIWTVRRRMLDWFGEQPQKHGGGRPVDPTPVLTQPGMISLVVKHLVGVKGVKGDIEIKIQARGIESHVSADHPSSGITYLTEASTRDGRFIYLSDSRGNVREHYVDSPPDGICLEPLPDLYSETGRTGLQRTGVQPSGDYLVASPALSVKIAGTGNQTG